MTEPVKPILVCMSWRGGPRLSRCLTSIGRSADHFSRIVISITASEDSDDMQQARDFQAGRPEVEVLCTGRELPTMQHQAFWINYLHTTGTHPTDWIYWLAYDDEVRRRGIDAIVDGSGNWPLVAGTAYFGPWALRHEGANELWTGDPKTPLESWTSFPATGPTRLTVADWIADQLRQPTYMQMSGSVSAFKSYIDLRDARPIKRGPMRIEMAVAASPGTTHIEEFPEPVSVIYGRSNSDRASYGRAARREDVHLLTRLARFGSHHPEQINALAHGVGASLVKVAGAAVGRIPLPQEEWRVRGMVEPD